MGDEAGGDLIQSTDSWEVKDKLNGGKRTERMMSIAEVVVGANCDLSLFMYGHRISFHASSSVTPNLETRKESKF
jgi:hypothetical protein